MVIILKRPPSHSKMSSSQNQGDCCNYCKKDGHFKVNCPKLNKKAQQQAEFGLKFPVLVSRKSTIVAPPIITNSLVSYASLTKTNRDIKIVSQIEEVSQNRKICEQIQKQSEQVQKQKEYELREARNQPKIKNDKKL